MVSFNNAGRFGNWYLEACTAMAYALRHGLEFSMPTGHGKDRFFNPVYCLHLVNPKWDDRLETIRLWENGHHYQPLPFEEGWRNKNIIIEGYRQSEKYFADFRNEILYLLNYPYEKKDGYVSIHVRRGDYLHLLNKHPQVGMEYYERAMSFFPDHKFKVFSDDIAWCKKAFEHLGVEFSTNVDIEADFIEMQNCEHNINSSSTFSWASAWHNRNPDKIVITPQKWFVDNYPLDTSDIIPENWIKI